MSYVFTLYTHALCNFLCKLALSDADKWPPGMTVCRGTGSHNVELVAGLTTLAVAACAFLQSTSQNEMWEISIFVHRMLDSLCAIKTKIIRFYSRIGVLVS